MIAKVRRWYRRWVPERPAPEIVTDLRAARAYGLEEQRRSLRSIREMGARLDVDYRELHRALFGREPWEQRGREG